MADQPEDPRQMHELLQAYARKRRADAEGPGSVEMPQPMRNCLLAEVRNKHRQRAVPAGSWLSRLGLRLPRLAVGLGVLALLGLGFRMLFWNEQPPVELAKQVRGLAEPPLRDEREQPQPLSDAPSPAVTLNLGPPPPPAAAPSPTAEPPVIPPPQRYSVTVAKEAKLLAEPSPQAIASGPGAAGMVLSAFELVQAGAQLRLIDGDGSVYEGRFLPGTEEHVILARNEKDAAPTKAEFRRDLQVAETLTAAQTKPALPAQLSVTSSVLNFRVRGTNRTLQTPVELEGVLLAASEASAPTTRRQRLQPQPDALQRETSSAVRFYRSQLSPQSAMVTNRALGQLRASTNPAAIQRIQGMLRIGSTNVIQLDAYRADGK